MTQAALARAAGISASDLSRIEAALVAAPPDTLVRIGLGLGGDVRFQFIPGAGIPIRDRYQARIVEAMLGLAHRRWKRFLEVVVHRPVRGVVDFVLHDPDEPMAIASEAQSLIKRVEQQLRWHNLKAEGLRVGSELPLDGDRSRDCSSSATRPQTTGWSRPSERLRRTILPIPSRRCGPSRRRACRGLARR